MGFGVGLALTPMNLAAMNAVSRDHHGLASGMLVTLSGLGSTLGVAATGAIFQQLQTDRTVSLAGDRGVTVSADQARELDGLLAGTPGAEHTLHQVAGGKRARCTRPCGSRSWTRLARASSYRPRSSRPGSCSPPC